MFATQGYLPLPSSPSLKPSKFHDSVWYIYAKCVCASSLFNTGFEATCTILLLIHLDPMIRQTQMLLSWWPSGAWLWEWLWLSRGGYIAGRCRCWLWGDGHHQQVGWWCWAWAGSPPHWPAGQGLMSRSRPGPAALGWSSSPPLTTTTSWNAGPVQHFHLNRMDTVSLPSSIAYLYVSFHMQHW